MANGVQLATAYISLNVRTDGIKKQVESALKGAGGTGRQTGSAIGTNIVAGIKEHLSGGRIGAIFAPIAITGVRWAASAGKAIGTALRTAIVSSVSLGVGAALLGATAALTAGLDRLKTIQRAQVQLSLTLPPAEIKRVTKDIQDVVKGTPIALDEALQAVPRALSAGIKPGKELNQYIKDIADTAASTGGQAGFGQIDIIFSQILGKGKLMGEELMQLTENGVDLRNALKNTFNWDDKKLNSMVAKGKVGMKEIQQAVEQTWGKDGGLSKKMGNTFDGAMGNLKASVARLGANVLGLIFGDPNNPDDPLKGAIDGITAFTQKIDTMGKWVADHREDIRGYFNGAKETASKLGDKIKDVVEWFKRMWQGAEEFGGKVGRAFDKAKDAVGRVKTSLTNVFDDVKKKFDSVFGPDGWFAKQFERLANLVDKVRDVLGLGPATANADTTPTNKGPAALPGGSAKTTLPGGGVKGSFGGSAIAPSGMGGRVPYGLPPGTDTGGYGTGSANVFPEWVMKVAEEFGIKPSTYAGHQQDNRNEPGYAPNPNNQNRGIDWVGPVENLQKFADYLASLPEGSLEQVIWQNPSTGKKTGIGGGKLNPGYYDDKTYAEHGGNDPDNIHVHTRQSMSIPLPGGGQPGNIDTTGTLPIDKNKWRAPGFSSGGRVWGEGDATSDSIPAMLSNGEHVLTADDVKKMGGQSGVYAFRAALKNGNIPGFAPGGPVDPNIINQTNDNLANLANAYAVAQAQHNELMQTGEATESQIMQSQQNMAKAGRELFNAQSDAPIINSGGTPPDRSKQNRVYDLTDELGLLQQQLKEQQESGDEIPYSQKIAQDYRLQSLQRERDQAVADLTGKGPGSEKDYAGEFFRSMGWMPAAAGSTGTAGTSSVARMIDMGNSVVSGLIDTGVNLGNMAISAAISAGAAAGSFGAAAPAAPVASQAASYGLQLLGNQGKTISSYWFGLAGIGADALLAQMFPLGMPRALGYDYTQFMPQLGIQQAATSTLEKMGSDAITKYFAENNPNKPVVPAVAAATGPAPVDPAAPPPGVDQPGLPLNMQGSVGGTQPIPPAGQVPTDQYTYPIPGFGNFNPDGAVGFARGGHVSIYDQGGILKPGTLALNASRKPEKVLTDKQWQAMANVKPAGRDAPLVKIDTIYGMNPEDVAKQIESKQKLAMMRFAGRP